MERREITVEGIVQGVGFRPFIHRLASQYQLDGFAKNRAGSVLIEVEGEPQSLSRFLEDLEQQPPALSRIDDVRWKSLPVRGERGFRIEHSDLAFPSPVFISPDMGVCADCLRELFDPEDRRYRYPFLNCTRCGPRLTIIEASPYDRERTTMAGFRMCPACRAEYDDPRDRRFHAQPTAWRNAAPASNF